MSNISIVTLVYYKNYNTLEKKCSVIKREMSKNDEIIFVLNRTSSKKSAKFKAVNREMSIKYHIDKELIRIAKKYAVLFVVPQKNGLATARNEGILNAKNEIIIVSDQDTIPKKNYIKNIKAHFNKNKCDFVFGKDMEVNEKGLGFGWWRNEFELAFSKRNQIDHLKKITIKNFANCAGRNIAFKKASFKKIGKYDDKFDEFIGEDSDLQLRFVKDNKKVYFLPKMQTKHFHPMNLIKLLKKFWINGKSSANWLFYIQKRSDSEKKIKNYLPYSDLIFLIVFIYSLIFLNIIYSVVIFFLYGLYKFLKKLRSKSFNLKFFILSLIILPIGSIVEILGFTFEVGRRRLLVNE